MAIETTRSTDLVRAGGWTLLREVCHRRWSLPLGGDARAMLVWSRPVAVRAVASDGQERHLPVRDWSRLAQIALLAAGAVAWWRIGRRASALHRRQRSEEA